MERTERIGVDLDNPSIFSLLKTYFNLKYISDYVYVYETGHGYHLKAYCPLPVELKIHLRRWLGDDPQRLQWDEVKLKAGLPELVDTLFQQKKKGEYESKEEYINPLSLPFTLPHWILKQRKARGRYTSADYSRLKKL